MSLYTLHKPLLHPYYTLITFVLHPKNTHTSYNHIPIYTALLLRHHINKTTEYTHITSLFVALLEMEEEEENLDANLENLYFITPLLHPYPVLKLLINSYNTLITPLLYPCYTS
jgi:hypothetical protein